MSKPGRSPKVDERGIVSVGRPFSDVEVKTMGEDKTLEARQVGEIFIKSTANCKGYFNNLDSGDLGYVDEEGYLYITGRKKNIIKHLGQTIAAQELEEIVDAMPDVRFSAAVGIDRGRIEDE